jgi:hypothetical protein
MKVRELPMMSRAECFTSVIRSPSIISYVCDTPHFLPLRPTAEKECPWADDFAAENEKELRALGSIQILGRLNSFA